MPVHFCDRCPVPPADDAEWAWRKERMAIRVAKIPDETRDSGVNLEYVWLTNNQTYNLGFPKGYDITDGVTRKAIATYLQNYVATHHLDGLFLDCPLDHVDLRAALEVVRDLRESMPDAAIMPNFGSWDAWELTKDIPRWRAWAELREITDWHFVEVAIPVQSSAWPERMRAFLKTRDENPRNGPRKTRFLALQFGGGLANLTTDRHRVAKAHITPPKGFGAPGRYPTDNLQLSRLALYALELPALRSTRRLGVSDQDPPQPPLGCRMKRRPKAIAKAKARRRLFKQAGQGVDLPEYRFRNHMPRHACFSAEREWVYGSAKRREERQKGIEE